MRHLRDYAGRHSVATASSVLIFAVAACGESSVASMGNLVQDAGQTRDSTADSAVCAALDQSCASTTCCSPYVCSDALGGGRQCAESLLRPPPDAGDDVTTSPPACASLDQSCAVAPCCGAYLCSNIGLSKTCSESIPPADAGSDGDAAGAERADGGTDAAGAAGLGCAGWQVERAAGSAATAAVVNGMLALQRPAGPALPLASTIYNEADLAVTQAGLTGDFAVTVAWQSFSGTTMPFIGPRIQAGIWMTGPNGGLVAQASAEVGRATGWASIVHGQQFTLNSLNPTPASIAGASGTFTLQRTAGAVTVSTTLNHETVSAQSTETFADQPLKLFLSIGDQDVGGERYGRRVYPDHTRDGHGGRRRDQAGRLFVRAVAWRRDRPASPPRDAATSAAPDVSSRITHSVFHEVAEQVSTRVDIGAESAAARPTRFPQRHAPSNAALADLGLRRKRAPRPLQIISPQRIVSAPAGEGGLIVFVAPQRVPRFARQRYRGAPHPLGICARPLLRALRQSMTLSR